MKEEMLQTLQLQFLDSDGNGVNPVGLDDTIDRAADRNIC